MGRKVRNNGKRTKKLVSQLAAERKKIVTALCLIGVMAVLWIRVLTQKAPDTAGAEIAAEPINNEVPSDPELKLSFIELPKIAGRNDVINKDFFASENWRHFIEGQRKRKGIEEVKMLSTNGNEEVMRKLAEKLKLEAILVSDNPQAYVNGDLIEVGDKMLIGDGIDAFECEVVTIEENTVVMKCKEAEILLKLEQEPITDN